MSQGSSIRNFTILGTSDTYGIMLSSENTVENNTISLHYIGVRGQWIQTTIE